MAIDNKDKVLNVPNLRFPEFTEEWKKTKIGDITSKVGSGVTPKGGSAVYKTSGHLFIRSQNVGNGCFLLDDVAYIDEATHKKQINTELKDGDVLLNITGASIGRTTVVNKNVEGGNVNQHVCIIRLLEDYSPNYICNYLLSYGGQKQIDSFQAGGNREGLNFEQIRSIKFFIPSFREQSKIASLLSLLEERIATQNKIIEDLKKLKVAIIEKVFSEKKCNYKIGDVISQVSIRNKSKKETNILSVSNKWGFVEQSEQFEDRIVASEDITNYKVVRTNDFAYNPARINVGSIARLKQYESGIVSPMYICFHSQNALLPEYLELFFYTLYFKHEMYKRLEGSVRLCLSFEGLTNIPIFIPEITTQREISIKVNSIETKIGIEETYLNALKDQKQYLLKHMFI